MAKPKVVYRYRDRPAKKRSRSKRSFLTLQNLGKIIRGVALVSPAITTLIRTDQSPEVKGKVILSVYTGWDFDHAKFVPEYLMRGYGPLLGAVLATYGIPKLISLLKKAF